MRRHLRLLFAAMICCSWPAFAAEEGVFFRGTQINQLAPRYALVIGVPMQNQEGMFRELKNPIKDAEAVSKALADLGFSVRAPHRNLPPEKITRQVIKHYLYDFALMLKDVKRAVGLVYFAGHGLELYGQTFLVAHDGEVRFDRDLNEELIPIQLFYDAFKFAGNKLNMLFIDSCRDFPFKGQLPSFGTPASWPESEPSSEFVVVAHSTLSGKKAKDGETDLSPYAQAFLEALKQPDIPLSKFYATISQYVYYSVEGYQVPDVKIAGPYDFVFNPTIASYNHEAGIYHTAELSQNRALIRKLQTTYGHGYFAQAVEEYRERNPGTVPPPTEFVELTAQTALRENPNLSAPVFRYREAGEQLAVITQLREFAGSQWIPVLGPKPNEEPYFIAAKNARPVRLIASKYGMQFSPGTGPGTEVLTSGSTGAVRQALKDKRTIRQVEVVGYLYKAPDADAPATDVVAARQAKVLDELQKAGYASGSRVVLKQRFTENPSLENDVELIVTESKA